jgi:hypothetical protein
MENIVTLIEWSFFALPVYLVSTLILSAYCGIRDRLVKVEELPDEAAA